MENLEPDSVAVVEEEEEENYYNESWEKRFKMLNRIRPRLRTFRHSNYMVAQIR